MYSLLVINFSMLIGIIMNHLKLFDTQTHTLPCFSLGVRGRVLLMPAHVTSDVLKRLLCGVPSGSWVSLVVLAAMSCQWIHISQPV